MLLCLIRCYYSHSIVQTFSQRRMLSAYRVFYNAYAEHQSRTEEASRSFQGTERCTAREEIVHFSPVPEIYFVRAIVSTISPHVVYWQLLLGARCTVLPFPLRCVSSLHCTAFAITPHFSFGCILHLGHVVCVVRQCACVTLISSD